MTRWHPVTDNAQNPDAKWPCPGRDSTIEQNDDDYHWYSIKNKNFTTNNQQKWWRRWNTGTTGYITIIVIILLNQCMISMQTPEAKVDSFNIDQLMEYNGLVQCLGQMHKEFEQCNKRGVEKAKSFLGQIELSAEWNLRLKCCGTWKLRDCWMRAARVKCTKSQSDMIYRLPDLIMPALVELCQDYLPESGKCNLTWLLVAGGGTIATIIIIICCCSVICIRKRYAKKEFRRVGLPPSDSLRRPLKSTDGQGVTGDVATTVIQTGISGGNIKSTTPTTSKPYQNGTAIIGGKKMNGTLSSGHHHHHHHHTSSSSNNNKNHHQHHSNHHHHHHHHHHNNRHQSPNHHQLDMVDAEEQKPLNNNQNQNNNNGQTDIIPEPDENTVFVPIQETVMS